MCSQRPETLLFVLAQHLTTNDSEIIDALDIASQIKRSLKRNLKLITNNKRQFNVINIQDVDLLDVHFLELHVC